MKNIITALSAFFFTGIVPVWAQQKSPVIVFKDKTVKINVHSVYDIRPEEDLKTIKVRNINKNDQAEILTFDDNLKFLKKEEEKFDIETENAKSIEQNFGGEAKVERFFDKETGEKVESVVLQENILRVKGAIMLNNQILNAGFLSKLEIEKGSMLHQFRSKRELLGGWTKRELTFFSPQQDVKLKTDEGKNMGYVTHKTLGEEFLFRNTASTLVIQKRKNLSNVDLNAPYASLGVLGAPTDTYVGVNHSVGKPKTLLTGDLLLVGIRPNNIKFAKAPTAEELLPYYYIFKVNAKTLETTAKNSFQKPVSRNLIFSKSLTYNGGILLVSAPLNMTGDAAPKDMNPRNYIIRHIAEDTKLTYEINYETPSGYTRFENCFEQPDGTIILWASVDSDKKDKHFNKKISGAKGFETDQYLIVVIKDGKIFSSQTISKESTQDIVIGGEFNKKRTFDVDRNRMVVQEIRFFESGTLVFGSIPYPDPSKVGVELEQGNVCMHFDKEGKFAKIYWLPSVSGLASQIAPTISRISETEFLWITSERVSSEKPFHTTKVVTLNTGGKTLSAPVAIGDESHRTYPKFSSYIDPEEKEVLFFGFDESGKELWMQRLKY